MRPNFAPTLCAATLILSGCATLPNGRGWGEDATLAPGREVWWSAVTDAAKSPRVWAPLVGAAVFQINGWDRKVSNWARENTPVFGSREGASRWSDDLLTASQVTYFGSVLAMPSGESGDWLSAKAKGFGVGLTAIAATGASTEVIKRVAGRERPNGASDESFPSGHVSHSAVLTQLTERDLRSIDMSNGARRAFDFGLDALTVGTAWGRVEAGEHFPSDTLVSMSLGHFFGMSFYDAFMGLSSRPHVALSVAPFVDKG